MSRIWKKECDEIPLYNKYDVLILGGGVGGIAAAKYLSNSNKNIAVMERRSELGWEITRARRIFLNYKLLAEYSGTVNIIINTVKSRGGFNNNIIDPMCLSTVLDDLMVESGIDMLFESWPASIELTEEGYKLKYATKSGYHQILANKIIDTTFSGRIAASIYKKISYKDKRPSIYSMLFACSKVDKMIETNIMCNAEQKANLLIRPTGRDGECQVDINFEDDIFGLHEFILLQKDIIQKIKEQIKGLQDAVISWTADEIWTMPEYFIDTGCDAKERKVIGKCVQETELGFNNLNLCNSDLQNTELEKNLVLAGPWLKCFPNSSNDTLKILNIILIGKAAGKVTASSI